ncbi:MAG TPA: hypothetical protein VNP72_03275, partial [Longimicrobium sp.]|nr:hypothetical protein [Longimicrobium sp.]
GAEPAPVPAGDDLRRLNRMLLETAWAWDARARPWGLRSRRIPLLALPRGAPAPAAGEPPRSVREALVAELNRLLEDPGLAAPERFPELAEELPALQRRFRGQLAWLNRVLLESAFPRAIERSYKPYRERLLGLIQVLRRGAATPAGILDIVAANLGIVGDGPEVEAARGLIEVQEFDPRQKAFYEGQVGFWEVFSITSDNPGASAPRVQVTVLDRDGIDLANLRLRDDRTDHAVLYPGRLHAGDKLLLEGGTVLLNGVAPPAALLGTVPELPRGTSRWKLDADVVVFGEEAGDERGVPVGRFDMPVGATFDGAALAPEGPIARVEVFSYRHTPGVFKVVIPWNIPGFTDKFDAEDHPRQQILPLVNRVKAAGVQALVAYREVFTETHDVDEGLRLAVAGRLLAETHETADAYRMESRQNAAEDQDQQDALVVNGVFDYTTFDSLNTLA